jgi:hypothetical protein
MKISLRRALKIATVAAAVMYGCLWLLAVLFGHLDPLESAIGSVYWAVLVFAGVFIGLLLAYGKKADD